MVGFAWSDHHGTYGTNRIRTFRCEVAGGSLQHRSTLYPAWRTRVHPALTWDTTGQRFVMAWREQNFATSVNLARTTWTGAWGGFVRPGPSTHTAPDLAAASAYPEVALWYAHEGA